VGHDFTRWLLAVLVVLYIGAIITLGVVLEVSQ
jgi:hypothetical protein